jgi:hypothetical protein
VLAMATRKLDGENLTDKERALQIDVAVADAMNPDGWRSERYADHVPSLYGEQEVREDPFAAVQWDDPNDLDWEPNPVTAAPARRPALPARSYRERLIARRSA